MSSINRTCHVLKSEKTLSIPRHVLFFDTETTMTEQPDGSIVHKLKLGWVCYYRRGDNRRQERLDWLFFTDADTFWEFILSHCPTKNKTWIIAHNIGFDFVVCEGFKYLTAAQFKVKFFHSKALTTIITVKAKGKSLAFVDSCNWFPMSLDSLGELLGIPKLTVDFNTVDFTDLQTYCKRDVEILIAAFKSLSRFLQSNRISRLCYTRASTAMAAYLLNHLDFPIYIHNNSQAVDLERDSYLGGRTECFFLGELKTGPYYILDVNSLYPFVMQSNKFPTRYIKIIHNPSPAKLAGFLENYAVVAKVLIKTSEPTYAVRRDRTNFPTGEFWVTLTTPDLKHALQQGHIIEITDAVLYEQAYVFKSFVERFYKLRQEFAASADAVYANWTKIFLNSLYGKFGQKGEVWELVGPCPGEPDRIEDVIDAQTGRRSRLRYLLGELYEMTGVEETRHSFPGIASHVTAFARRHLWRLIEQAGNKNYYYCDTDSLFVNQAGYDNLTKYIDPIKLGSLKLEKKVNNIVLYGLKDYIADDKIALKGIRKNAVRLTSNSYKQEQWPSLQGMLVKQNTAVYTTLSTSKTLNRQYHKGEVTISGWIVPFDLDVSPPLPF